MSNYRLVSTSVIVACVAALLWFQVPRLAAEIGQAERYRPATSARATEIRCKMWLMVVMSECTVSHAPTAAGGNPGSFADWRFGRPPEGPYTLLQRDDDPARLTTDASLATVGNRLALLVLFGLFGIASAAEAWTNIRRRLRRG